MAISKKSTLVISVCTAALLSACSNENDASSANPISQMNASTQHVVANGAFVAFTGNKQAAELVKRNTLQYVDLLYPTVAFDNMPYTQTSDHMPGETVGLLRHQRAIIHTTLAQAVNQASSNPDAAVYDYRHCTYQGTARQTNVAQGRYSHVKQTANYTFSACQPHKTLSLHGDVTLSTPHTASNSDDVNQDKHSVNTAAPIHTLSFAKLSLNDGGKTYLYSGTIEIVDEQTGRTTKANLQRINAQTNEQHYFKDLTWAEGDTDHLSGRIYDVKEGYIELSASEDLILDSDGIPTQGQFYLNGRDYAKVSIGKPNNNQYGAIHIEIDEYGDGFNELQMSKNIIYPDNAEFYAAR